ncbi:expressed unknown protein [Seminavis robusta]|uniref:MAPEG family protein n=1 Tax=Seminavis robusta TaxID=568900 RepID=A0A9N8F133_9STRA|nr:expressed unknown protein [Seminavis robusta]|eukprot:Sro2227_g319850.1 n/a (195) ;mRNA; r:10510-11094
MTNKSDSPVDKMNDYKGGPLPSPVIPLLGFSLGVGVPYALVESRIMSGSHASSGNDAVDSVLATLQSLGFASILFAAEFFLGAAARSTSTKASFSPAAAAASGQNPFEVVQANRIHQNHIESFCILFPSAVAAAAAGADAAWIRAAVMSWVGFRFVYRLGYCNQNNPFWRITGVAAAQTQSVICGWLWYKASNP